MDVISRIEDDEPSHAPAGLITKMTEHPLGLVLLGEVVGAHWLNDSIVLYYADKHKALLSIVNDEIVAVDYEVPMS